MPGERSIVKRAHGRCKTAKIVIRLGIDKPSAPNGKPHRPLSRRDNAGPPQ